MVLDLADEVFSLVADHYRAQQETSPGQSILLAVRSLLAAGLAHIQSVDTPGAPPIAGGPEAAVINSRLGWVHAADGTSRPGGPTIGYLVNPSGARGIPPHVLLDPKNSFSPGPPAVPGPHPVRVHRTGRLELRVDRGTAHRTALAAPAGRQRRETRRRPGDGRTAPSSRASRSRWTCCSGSRR